MVFGIILAITTLFIEKFIAPRKERNEDKHLPVVICREDSYNKINREQLNQQEIISTLTDTSIGQDQRHSRGYDEYEMFHRTKRYTA